MGDGGVWKVVILRFSLLGLEGIPKGMAIKGSSGGCKDPRYSVGGGGCGMLADGMRQGSR